MWLLKKIGIWNHSMSTTLLYKEIINVDGKNYILALPIKADVALIKAHKADKAGNLIYRLSARNFNPIMAMAAGTVVAEVEEIGEIGDLNPDEVMTPGIFVDYLVKSEVKGHG